MSEFRMPSLGADMEAGTVVEWLVKVGDVVHHGDIVAVVDTDKSDIEVEIFDDGVIDELLVPEGVRVDVGTPLARLRTVGAPPEKAGPPEKACPPAAPAATPSPARAPVVGLHTGEIHSPVLRRLASHLHVDLSAVTGTGPDGRITRADIEAASRGASPAPAVDQPDDAGSSRDRSASMRRAIAALMARSSREIPHYHVGLDIDVEPMMRWLERTNAGRPLAERLLPAAVLLKSAAVAAREVPELNGFWVDDELRPAPHVHLGVAIRLRGGGLVAPAIHDAAELPLPELMARLQDLVQRTRSGRLRSSEMSDPTFTVTQLGDQGVDRVSGVIYPPQVALLGLGRINERPWAIDGMVGARRVVTATLAADHRATDGIVGAKYLNVFDRLLQEPEAL